MRERRASASPRAGGRGRWPGRLGDRAADFGWTEGKRVCSAHLLLEDCRVDVRAAHHDISSVTRGEGLQAVAVFEFCALRVKK